MQLESPEKKEIEKNDIDTLAEIIATFIIENILKDEKSTLAKISTASRFCQETEASKMAVR
jgi:hypothetical protein